MDNQWEWKELEDELLKDLKDNGSKFIEGDYVRYRVLSYEGSVGSTEWWTDEDYKEHKELVTKLKIEGRYLKPWIAEVTLKHFPEYDGPEQNKKLHPVSGKPLESYRFVMIDFANNTTTNLHGK